jgi:hypothetical protein
MKKQSEILKLIEHRYTVINSIREDSVSRKAFIADEIFDITTYDDDLSEEYCDRILEVLKVIYLHETFDYIEIESNYRNYIDITNMGNIQSMLEWGTSIRGAWLDTSMECFKIGENQIYNAESLYLAILEFLKDEAIA